MSHYPTGKVGYGVHGLPFIVRTIDLTSSHNAVRHEGKRDIHNTASGIDMEPAPHDTLSTPAVTIVGAGVVGLATAISLVDAGVKNIHVIAKV